ncbi:hypothetical protein D9M69_536320 [compost metagenome]
MTARRKAAASMSASPHPIDRLASEGADSRAAPMAESPAAQNTRRAGRRPSSHHSTKGVIATHKLMRKAALLARVSETPKVSHRKMASRLAPSRPPTASPWRHCGSRHSGRSAGSSTRKVRPKRSATNSSTGSCCVACLATA